MSLTSFGIQFRFQTISGVKIASRIKDYRLIKNCINIRLQNIGQDLIPFILQTTPRKKFYSNLSNRLFNFVTSIRSENTFKTNINLFHSEKSPFQPILNERNSFFNIIYLV